MAIEPTILNDLMAPPEMAADPANARGSQDFSQFLSAMTPAAAAVDAPEGVSPATPAVGNPTPAAMPGQPQDGDPSNPLQAMLMMADQLGLDAKPAVAPTVPLRTPAGASKAPVDFAPLETAAEGALPGTPLPADSDDDAKARPDGEDASPSQMAAADPAAMPVIAVTPPAPAPVSAPAAPPQPAAAVPPGLSGQGAAPSAAPPRGSGQAVADLKAAPAPVEDAGTEVQQAPGIDGKAASAVPAGAVRHPLREMAPQPFAANGRDVLQSLGGVAVPLPDPGKGDAATALADTPSAADDTAAAPLPLPQAAPSAPNATAGISANAAAAPPAHHQQTIEDLLVGNAVEDQWVDRLSRDVQALVSSDNREARLHLRPRDLGDLAIRLNIGDGQAKIHFTVETAAAQALIAEAVPRLQAMMENKGFRLDQASVDLGGQGASAGRNGAGAGHDGQQSDAPGFMTTASPNAVAAVARAIARQTAFERYA